MRELEQVSDIIRLTFNCGNVKTKPYMLLKLECTFLLCEQIGHCI